MAIKLGRAKLQFIQQHPIQVFYDNSLVGEYVTDLMVEGEVMVELKAAKAFDEVRAAQCMNYL